MKVNKKKIIIAISVVILMLLIIFLVGRSFGFFKYIKKGETVNIITINGIEVEILNEEADSLNLENAYPLRDDEGLNLTPFEFSMTNTSSRSLTYTLRIENDTEKQESCVLEDQTICPKLTTNYIKYSYKKNDGTYSEPQLLSNNNNVIASGVIKGNETVNSSIIIWIDSEAGNEIMNHYFFGKVIITGEQYIEKNLKEAILTQNTLIEDQPDLTTSFLEAGDATGLYKSIETNSGEPTYYFRGNVENNYVSFAGFTWRIVRINEDGTIRLIMQDGINNNEKYAFNPSNGDVSNMYYSNSGIDGAKYQLETWYEENIAKKDYSNRVSTGNYFCEQAKVKAGNTFTSGNVTMTPYDSYTTDFKCSDDKNGYGLVNASVGLITCDDVVHAGAYFGKTNVNHYLNNKTNYWSMCPAGFSGSNGYIWRVGATGNMHGQIFDDNSPLRPVVNLKSDTTVIGSGTSDSPYKVLVEEPVKKNLKEAILDENTLIEKEPTLTTSSNNSNDVSGLYKSTATNDGSPTYYFRGNVENNYVDFAGFTWRIVRINEDGTIRLIMQDGINDNTTYAFNSISTSKENMYYSNSDTAKSTLNDWYSSKIAGNATYSNRVASGNYFCEEAKVAYNSNYATNSGASMTVYSSYTPNFTCKKDKNGKGIVSGSVGLISYDEVAHAGGYYSVANDNYYLYNNIYFWTMSPAGFSGSHAVVWDVLNTGGIYNNRVYITSRRLRPVLNLKADTTVTGSGTSDSPYKVIVEEPVKKNLKEAILDENTLIEKEPTLTKTSEEVNESGLYKSTATNSGEPTYYFRGNVENNYVDFAGFTWRVVRINEDGTIRLIMTKGINNNANIEFNTVRNSKENMYYSNSDTAKSALETWYNNNIDSNVKYSDRVANGKYFCEEAKAAYNSTLATNSGASMTTYDSYTPNFTCEQNGKDGNGKGYVSGSVGLINYDEVVYAGGYFNVANSSYYLYNGTIFWTMSPAGFANSSANAWIVSGTGYIYGHSAIDARCLRPVLNLKADTTVTGLGTSDSPYKVVVEEPVKKNLKEAILDENTLIEKEPTLTKTSEEANESGLYKSTATNDGSPTYYFRGAVDNNYVDFAGFTWRVVRINEDGTIRLILSNGINEDDTYVFNAVRDSKENMYYSTSDTAKPMVNAWYNDKIASNVNYSNRVANGNYFCEEAKVARDSNNATNSGASMTVYSSYTPNFTCEKNGKDGNGKGYVSGSVGLISYDEVLHAGGYPDVTNKNYYLYNNTYYWTMSPAGFFGPDASAWSVDASGLVNKRYVTNTLRLRPVLNLKADTTVTGLGTSDSPYKVVVGV